MVISIILALFVLNKKTNPAYKLSWIILILILPIFGGMFYIFFGRNKLTKQQRLKMKSIDDKMQSSLIPQKYILDELYLQNEAAANQSKYIQNYAFCPPYTNTVTEYLPSGEIKFQHLKDELKKAKHFIFLEYFIINEGLMWNSIFDILVEKASNGVDVRIIYDDIGSLFKLPYRYNKKLESIGIKCSVFNPLLFILSPRLNYRDHRKIAIIDGHTGFTGGINLADEYINKINRFGHWKDTAIMLKGDAVWNLTVMFLSIWDNLRGIEEDFNKFKNCISINISKNKNGYVQPFADNPLDNEAVGETVYLNLIYKAKKYVYITTPYLIIGNEMITALTSAAKGGVDIRLITPYIGDKKFVHEVTRSHYKFLIENGVRIYEYTPGFIHSKTYVSDDEYGVVGSINMDYRSLFLHFECGVWMYKTKTIIDMKKDFFSTLNRCKEITLKDIKKTRWPRKMLRLILRVFSPLL
jgi:cardiolipin synthase